MERTLERNSVLHFGICNIIIDYHGFTILRPFVTWSPDLHDSYRVLELFDGVQAPAQSQCGQWAHSLKLLSARNKYFTDKILRI